MIHPFLVIQIPFYGFLDTLLKLERWLPTQFLLQLSRVDGVTHIVTLSVCYISNQIQVSTLRATEQSINGLDDYLDNIDVLPLVETADVVSLGNLTLVENHINGTGMIHYIQPVAHVLTLTIYRQWLAMTDIVDEQRNQLPLGTGMDHRCSSSWSRWLAYRMYRGKHGRSGLSLPWMQSMESEDCTW